MLNYQSLTSYWRDNAAAILRIQANTVHLKAAFQRFTLNQSVVTLTLCTCFFYFIEISEGNHFLYAIKMYHFYIIPFNLCIKFPNLCIKIFLEYNQLTISMNNYFYTKIPFNYFNGKMKQKFTRNKNKWLKFINASVEYFADKIWAFWITVKIVYIFWSHFNSVRKNVLLTKSTMFTFERYTHFYLSLIFFLSFRCILGAPLKLYLCKFNTKIVITADQR